MGWSLSLISPSRRWRPPRPALATVRHRCSGSRRMLQYGNRIRFMICGMIGAAFHFLTEPTDRQAYVQRLTMALRPGGHAIIATFSPDGPERCSGLPIIRYDAASLSTN